MKNIFLIALLSVCAVYGMENDRAERLRQAFIDTFLKKVRAHGVQPNENEVAYQLEQRMRINKLHKMSDEDLKKMSIPKNKYATSVREAMESFTDNQLHEILGLN